MMPDRKPAPVTQAELDELDELPDQGFRAGEIGKIMKPGLADLVAQYVPAGSRRDHILGFVSWIPERHLEEYLVMALEYGADRSRPAEKRRRHKPLRTVQEPRKAASGA